MPSRCVVFGCSNSPNPDEGIGLHFIPFWTDERPEAKRRRKRWVDFVKTKRAKWQPTKSSAICSVHFTKDAFERMHSSLLPGQMKRLLKRDDFGISVWPSIQAIESTSTNEEISARSRRMVSFVRTAVSNRLEI